MSRTKLTVLGALAAPIVAYLVLLGAWALWGRAAADETVGSAVLAGVDVGGQQSTELDATIDELVNRFAGTQITINSSASSLTTTAGELGLSVDAAATKAAALRIGHNDPFVVAPVRWVKSWFSDRTADVKLDVDRARAEATLDDLESDDRTEPTEPTMVRDDARFALEPGTPGKALRVDDILAALPRAVDSIGGDISVDVEQAETPPQLADADVQAVVDQANTILDETLNVTFQGSTFTMEGAALADGIGFSTEGGEPHVTIEEKPIALQLLTHLTIPLNPTKVKFDIVGGVPTPVGGSDAQVCCDESTTQTLIDAFLSGQTDVSLEPKTVTVADGIAWANTLGVKEVIGEFTTNYPAGQSRVKNIHRISDLTRGVLIAPGETFSANGFVGKRTVENGFVLGGVIEQGEFTEDIGGGVSQWATTTFNAAFFAGLEIPEFKAHSRYISRYPYGREATLAFPSVDLKIENNTPYGVVIWPTYTNSSITVQMWSTRWVAGTQASISQTSGCGSVTVTRARLWVDGRSENDTFRSAYRCEPAAGSTTTAAPTTTAPAAPPVPPPAG